MQTCGLTPQDTVFRPPAAHHSAPPCTLPRVTARHFRCQQVQVQVAFGKARCHQASSELINRLSHGGHGVVMFAEAKKTAAGPCKPQGLQAGVLAAVLAKVGWSHEFNDSRSQINRAQSACACAHEARTRSDHAAAVVCAQLQHLLTLLLLAYAAAGAQCCCTAAKDTQQPCVRTHTTEQHSGHTTTMLLLTQQHTYTIPSQMQQTQHS